MVLTINYWSYEFDATSFHKFKKKFFDTFFVIIVAFQFLS